MYMDEHKQYSSIEAYKVAEMARAKGLILLEGPYQNFFADPGTRAKNSRGFCVAKVLAGQYLTLRDDGTVCQLYSHDGPFMYKTVWFDLTLGQAKELITNFDGVIKSNPNFFAYIRVYAGEPRYYGYLQMLHLEEFARKHGITYKEKFVCIGGHDTTVWHPEDSRGIDDILAFCEKSFSKMDKDSFLVVSDLSRLNDSINIWTQCFDIISVSFSEVGYTEYCYHESEKLRKAIQEYERDAKDMEYEDMCQEYEEMMLEQGDQPVIEAEETYEECSNEHD